jgi:hypothetical protein
VRAYSPYGFADWMQEWHEDKPGQLVAREAHMHRDRESRPADCGNGRRRPQASRGRAS